MKKLLTLIAVALMAIPTLAQKDPAAKKVLDATASKLASMKSVKASFNITTFAGAHEQGSTSGTMLLSGKKYKMEAPDLMTWFDGKTQWTYIPDNDEVNVSTPSKEEQAQSSPYAFIGLYKKGYNYTMTRTTYNGKSMNEVRLLAETSSAEIQEVRLVVSDDYIPYSVRIRQGKKSWTRIRISGLTKQKFSNDTFTFPASKYPNAEIIDLR